jgi:hypothetical protein
MIAGIAKIVNLEIVEHNAAFFIAGNLGSRHFLYCT